MKSAMTMAVAMAATVWFSNVSAQVAPAERPTVQWIEPAMLSANPQTPEQQAAGRSGGRALPTPEILQPTLDPALPVYKVRRDLQISGSFKGAASDVLPPLVKRWIDAFRKLYPNAVIDVKPPYAGSLGAIELVKENLDFVFVSRELKPDDIKDFRAKFGYDPLSVPISGGAYRHYGFLDAIAFFVHKDNPIEKLSYDQLDAMYSSTRHRGGQAITKWGQLGLTGAWAEKSINLYGIKPWNGFEEFIRQRILSVGEKRGEWRDDINFDKVVFPVAKRVTADLNGIGYAGIAYIDAPVKVVMVGESANGPFHAASHENVALARYPLSRLIFFNTNKAPGKPLNPALEEFLRFVLSREGQQIVLDHAIYMPLRSHQVQAARVQLGK